MILQDDAYEIVSIFKKIISAIDAIMYDFIHLLGKLNLGAHHLISDAYFRLKIKDEFNTVYDRKIAII